MKKNNVFENLAMDDQEEVEVVPKRKLSKKDQRKNEKTLRNAYGDHVQKDTQAYQNEQKHTGGKEKNDRHSGTKNQAFGLKSKNGGYEQDLKQFEGDVRLEQEEALEEEENEQKGKDVKHKKSSGGSKKKHHGKKMKYDEKNFPSLS